MRFSSASGFTALCGTVLLSLYAGLSMHAQTCKVLPAGADGREPVTAAALEVARAVQSGNVDALTRIAGGEIAQNFAGTAALAADVKPHLAAATLTATYAYNLVASEAPGGANASSDFICTGAGSDAEVDFSFNRLPPGHYAFAMVEAAGPTPFLLSELLQQDAAGAWKLVGFYPHARSAGERDGVSWWRAAREHAKAGQAWSAWLEFGLAERLLRPAPFVSSSNLQKLETERQSAAPPALSDGLSLSTPLVVAGANGKQFRVTGLEAVAGSTAGVQVEVRFAADALPDASAETARNLTLAKALLVAHPELRSSFADVRVLAETAGGTAFASVFPMGDLR